MTFRDPLDRLLAHVRGDEAMAQWGEDDTVAVIAEEAKALRPLADPDVIKALSPDARKRLAAGLRADLDRIAAVLARSDAAGEQAKRVCVHDMLGDVVH